MKKFTLVLASLFSFVIASVAQTTASMGDVIIDSNTGTGKLYVKALTNVDFTAFQGKLVLPEGFSVNYVKSGRNTIDEVILNSDRFDGCDHTIAYSRINNNFSCSSNTNMLFFNDDVDGNPVEDLFYFGIKADESVTDGTYEVRIDGFELLTVHADGDILFNLASNILVGTATAITDVAPAQNEAIYNLAGLRMKNMQKGINIVGGKKILK